MLDRQSLAPPTDGVHSNGQAPAGKPVKTRTARGYLGHKRPTWERADLAAQVYVQRRPIEAPTLQQLAFAYRVSVASIQCRLNGKSVTVDEAVASWRSWTPAQRADFGRGAGVANIWDDAIAPVITEERASPQAAK
jgi:hypothetical protein